MAADVRSSIETFKDSGGLKPRFAKRFGCQSSTGLSADRALLLAWTTAFTTTVFRRAADPFRAATIADCKSATLPGGLYRPTLFAERVDCFHQFGNFHLCLQKR